MHPDNLLYTFEHVWVKKEADGNLRLGMTYYYEEQLKKIVYIDMVMVGSIIKQGDVFASFESSKTAADLTSPLSGTILETNSLLNDKPGMINKEPYGEGWIVLLKPSHLDEMNSLLPAKKYIESILE